PGGRHQTVAHHHRDADGDVAEVGSRIVLRGHFGHGPTSSPPSSGPRAAATSPGQGDPGPSALPGGPGRGARSGWRTVDPRGAMMPVIDGRTWLEHLDPATCWELLAATPVGRIGVIHDSAPEIYPVNHVVDGRSIVFRTDPGTKLRGLLRS